MSDATTIDADVPERYADAVSTRLSRAADKGGPKTGRFLQLTDVPTEDLEVPGEPYAFGTLIGAQADGDLQTLRNHGLPVVCVTAGDIDASKEQL